MKRLGNLAANFCCVHWTLLIILLAQCAQHGACIKWLALYKVRNPWNDTKHCPKNKTQRHQFGLTGQQVKLCKRWSHLMPSIIDSTKAMLQVCEDQFMDQRWNCTSARQAPQLSADLAKGTREQAYVYALSAAAIAFAVARGCGSQTIFNCPCGELPTGDAEKTFKWKGCADNIAFGIVVSEEFADSPWTKQNLPRRLSKKQRFLDNDVVQTAYEVTQKRSTPKATMNQHNNDVGRKILKSNMEIKCKCHGVSNSCTMKSCIPVVMTLTQLGVRLKEKYKRATEVHAQNNHPSVERQTILQPVALMGAISDDDLIYIRKSPDYCNEDKSFGSLGTKGRSCNATQKHTHLSCDSMCCGRGYVKTVAKVSERCECKFIQCCYVRCNECEVDQERHYCK